MEKETNPMIIAILKNACDLYHKNFLAIVSVTVAIWLPLDLLISYMDYFVFDPENIRISFKFSQFLDNFIGIIATAGVIWIGYASSRGEKPTFKQAMRIGIHSWGRMWWTRLLTGLALLLGFLLLIFPGLYLLIRLTFIEQIAVCERLSGSAAMRRSFEVSKGHFWTLFLLGVLFLFMLIGIIACTILPTVFIPELDHWLVDASTSLFADLVGAFGTLCVVSAYTLFSASAKPIAVEPIVETENPCVQTSEME
jgi:hypothetical protein